MICVVVVCHVMKFVFLTLKCVFILIMSVTRKCFGSRFFGLFDKQNMNHCVYAVGGKSTST